MYKSRRKITSTNAHRDKSEGYKEYQHLRNFYIQQYHHNVNEARHVSKCYEKNAHSFMLPPPMIKTYIDPTKSKSLFGLKVETDAKPLTIFSFMREINSASLEEITNGIYNLSLMPQNSLDSSCYNYDETMSNLSTESMGQVNDNI